MYGFQGKHEKKDDGIDWRRVSITSGFGAFFVGPVGHSWYAPYQALCLRILLQVLFTSIDKSKLAGTRGWSLWSLIS